MHVVKLSLVSIFEYERFNIEISFQQSARAFPEIQVEISFLLWWMMLQYFEFEWYDMEEKNRTSEPVISRGRKLMTI